MAKYETIQQNLTKDKYEPVSTSRKLSLLLQRSFRYSYRQRSCTICPNILCELLLPFFVILLLALSRFGADKLSAVINNGNQTLISENEKPCSQDLNTPPTSSNDLIAKCFQYRDTNNIFSLKLPHPSKILYLFNIIAPNINAQVIITYILARKSQFCNLLTGSLNGVSNVSFFTSIGDDTNGYNWAILVLHIIIFLLILIIADSGLLKFSFFNSDKSEFDENILDNDVLAERHRILNLDHNQNATSLTSYEEERETDHLIVHDLVKRYRKRHVLAVNHLTFGAKRGEAFGLLGYNVCHTKQSSYKDIPFNYFK